MKKSILNLEGVEVLSKKQMRNVGGGDGPCHAFIRNADGSASGWGPAISLTAAEFLYAGNDTRGYGYQFSDGSYVSGYCCASCASKGVI